MKPKKWCRQVAKSAELNQMFFRSFWYRDVQSDVDREKALKKQEASVVVWRQKSHPEH